MTIVLPLLLLLAVVLGLAGPDNSVFIAALMFFAAPFIVLLLILTTASVLGSFAQKYKGYLNTKFVDFIFVVPALGVLVITLPFLREDLFIVSNGSYRETFIGTTWSFYILVVVVSVTAIYLNHRKFQKTEDEISVPK